MIDKALIQKVKEKLNKGVNYTYFFDNLTSPDWIVPLSQEGFFKSPPKAEKEGGYISFPDWPESRYLARMADKSPELVTNIILSTTKTDNHRVHESYIDCALKVPIKLANKIAKVEEFWIKEQNSLFILLPKKYGELIGYLSEQADNSEVFKLAAALLSLHLENNGSEDEDAYSRKEVKAKFDKYNYKRIIQEIIEPLRKCNSFKSFILFSDLLKQAFDLNRWDKNSYNDPSYIFRPSIEDHSQNHSHREVENVLIEAVRDISLSIIEAEPEKIKRIINELHSRKYTIFQRLELYLLSSFPTQSKEIVEIRLTNKQLYDDPSLHHEFYNLLKVGFPLLTNQGRETILEWIKAEISYDYVKEEVLNFVATATEDDVQSRLKYKTIQKLSPIAEYLEGDFKNYYQALVSEGSKPEHPEFLSWSSGVRTGPNSPLTSDDFTKMGIEKIVEFLQEWAPSNDHLKMESPEGINRVLQTVIPERVYEFSKNSQLFINLQPTYNRSLIEGLTKAITTQADSLCWAEVLDLCEFVVNQKDEAEQSSDFHDWKDLSWRNTRLSITRFLTTALGYDSEKKADYIPFNYQEQIWRILKPLTDDPEPDDKPGEKQELYSSDPLTTAINTTRGVAIDALIHYAFWYRRNCCSNDLTNFSLSNEPKLRITLETHLNIENDPSLAIRSVYGQHFNSLLQLDRKWSLENIYKVFPFQEKQRQYFEIAIEAFLAFNNAYLEDLPILEPIFCHAIETMNISSEPVSRLKDYRESLAEYLAIYYKYGRISLEDESLLSLFYSVASEKYRDRLLGFIGRRLIEDANEEQITRFRLLIDSRINTARQNPADFIEELSEFSWWFNYETGEQDQKWILEKAIEILQLTKKIEPRFFITEKLPKLFELFPEDTFKLLLLLINLPDSKAGIYDLLEPIREIFPKVLKLGSEEMKKEAIDTLNILIAQGNLSLRELLRS